jgi:hypothetical protein
LKVNPLGFGTKALLCSPDHQHAESTGVLADYLKQCRLAYVDDEALSRFKIYAVKNLGLSATVILRSEMDVAQYAAEFEVCFYVSNSVQTFMIRELDRYPRRPVLCVSEVESLMSLKMVAEDPIASVVDVVKSCPVDIAATFKNMNTLAFDYKTEDELKAGIRAFKVCVRCIIII